MGSCFITQYRSKWGRTICPKSCIVSECFCLFVLGSSDDITGNFSTPHISNDRKGYWLAYLWKSYYLVQAISKSAGTNSTLWFVKPVWFYLVSIVASKHTCYKVAGKFCTRSQWDFLNGQSEHLVGWAAVDPAYIGLRMSRSVNQRKILWDQIKTHTRTSERCLNPP